MTEITFFEFKVDTSPGSRAAWIAGKALKLYPREHAILKYLCTNPGKPKDKEELYRSVYPEHAGRDITTKDYNVLSTYISGLRGKIRAAHPEKGYDLLVEDISRKTPPNFKAYIQLRAPYYPGKKRIKIFGQLTLDPETGIVGAGRGNDFQEVVLGLPLKRILLGLAGKVDEPVNDKELFEFVYGDHPPGEREYSKLRFDQKITKNLSNLRTALDESVLGASVFIEKVEGGYQFTRKPNITGAVRSAAALAHDADSGEEDDVNIHIGDTFLTPNGNVFSVMLAQAGHPMSRTVSLDENEQALLLHLSKKGNYGRYIHVSEVVRNLPTLKGEQRQEGSNNHILGVARRLAAKVNSILPYEFVQVTEVGYCIGLSVEKLPLPVDVQRKMAREDASLAFAPRTKTLGYGDLEFDPSCHAIRNKNDKKTIIVLSDSRGKLLEQLMLNAGKPVTTANLIAKCGTTAKSLKDGGPTNRGLLGDIDHELGKIGLGGIVFSTPDISHVMLDNNAKPVIPKTARTVNVKEGNNRFRVGQKVIDLLFRRSHTYILNQMLAAAGELCFEHYAKKEHAQHFPLKADNKPYALAEMNELLFARIMTGLAKKLNSLGNTECAVFRNFRGCYRLGPEVRYALD